MPLPVISETMTRLPRFSDDPYEWFDRVGYDVDIPSLEREFGMKGTKLVDWAARQRA